MHTLLYTPKKQRRLQKYSIIKKGVLQIFFCNTPGCFSIEIVFFDLSCAVGIGRPDLFLRVVY
ncbi:MAG: hypothetical protein LUG13_07340, partial [Oscillospiraceae bacterium]|nr:hypothetical protein [Oscillospiraceae bacterium]